jgi:hypothetical protein
MIQGGEESYVLIGNGLDWWKYLRGGLITPKVTSQT